MLDLDSRRLKAIKIERLLDLPRAHSRCACWKSVLAPAASRIISVRIRHCASRSMPSTSLTTGVNDGYRFQLVTDTTLPFPDSLVRCRADQPRDRARRRRDAQLAHLLEIRRVLRTDGIGYLAVPNRWQLVEPHYRLAFLSWWPHSMAVHLPERMRGVDFYDCEPLSLQQVEHLLGQSGFVFTALGLRALRQTLELEYPVHSVLRRVFDRVPDFCISAVAPMIPTLIYRFSRVA